jgi:CP family cyanate transporter-like MFS transporter
LTFPSRGLWLAALALVAFNLRPVISSVPPLVDQLVARFGLSAAAAGALTTLPVVCMGLFAPLAAVAARRYGPTLVLASSVLVIGVGAGLRFLGVVGLYSGAVVAGIGIAVAGTLLPSLVRARYPTQVGPVTGLYTTALIGGAFLAAGITEPLRSLLDVTPQVALSLWAVPAFVACVAWLLAPHGPAMTAPGRVSFPWRSRSAWLGTLFMGGQSLLFYATLAWLASSYTSLGRTAAFGGLLLAVFSATQLVTALAMPSLAHRTASARPWIAFSVGITTLGLALVAFAPSLFGAAPWIWASLLGLGMGGNLALALLVLTENAPTPQDAPAFTGMAFFVGYLLAAVGPVAAGALRDLTGGFTVVFATLTVLGALTLAAGVAAAPRSSR